MCNLFSFLAQINERQRLLANEKCCCHKPQKIVPAEKLENLWIVDASIMPNITSGNINAPVMMLSYLSSKLILEELKQYNK